LKEFSYLSNQNMSIDLIISYKSVNNNKLKEGI